MKKFFTVAFLLLGLTQVAIASTPETVPPLDPEKGYVEPFQLFDNVFYVGDKWVSAYAIKTSAGLILIDTLESPYGRWIPGSMQRLGLNPADIKYIVITHGHSDHLACAQYLQSKYGSKVVMAAADLPLAKQQSAKSQSDEYGAFTLPKFDLVERDKTVLELGDTSLRLHLTPGHTPGSMSVDFFVKSGEQQYRAFIIGGMGTNFEGFGQAKEYQTSVRRIRSLTAEKPQVQVNLANHPHMNQLFERKGLAENKDPITAYVDRAGFLALLDKLENRSIEKLEEESLQYQE